MKRLYVSIDDIARKGKLVKCPCDECVKDPKAGWFPAHKKVSPPYAWIRFLPYHYSRTFNNREHIKRAKKEYCASPEGKKFFSKHAKEMGIKFRASPKGKKFYRDNGKKLGKMYGGKSYDTKHERIVARLLNECEIKFKHQRKISNGEHKTGCYWIDLYLPKWKIALEVDGISHSKKNIRKRDSERDIFLLRRYGIRTVRIKNRDVVSLTKKVLLKLIIRASRGRS